MAGIITRHCRYNVWVGLNWLVCNARQVSWALMMADVLVRCLNPPRALAHPQCTCTNIIMMCIHSDNAQIKNSVVRSANDFAAGRLTEYGNCLMCCLSINCTAQISKANSPAQKRNTVWSSGMSMCYIHTKITPWTSLTIVWVTGFQQGIQCQ